MQVRPMALHAIRCTINATMEISHPVLVSLIALLGATTLGILASPRIAAALNRYDERRNRLELECVTTVVPGFDCTDVLGEVDALIHEEAELVRDILRERVGGAHVSPEHWGGLRQLHRRGLAIRHCCGDPILASELAWLQRYGVLALTADAAELEPETFEVALRLRVMEVTRTIETRRSVREQ
jgi:hypothetical protein